jgi:purine-binding chemotaxis protein CheW
MGVMERFDSTRAALLAREYLIFRLENEEYAIDILKVQEIRGYDAVTRIVGAPEYIKGVVNLRGAIVPILDLRLKFRLADVRYDAFTVVIILNVRGQVVGAVVDSVSDVVELGSDQVRPAPDVSADPDGNFVAGLGSIGNGEQQRMLVLIDIEKLMAGADLGRLVATA